MFYKKCMLLGVGVVFSCAGMERGSQKTISQEAARQEVALQGIAPESSMQARPLFKDVAIQTPNQSMVTHELAQRVAQISLVTSRMTKGCVCVDDFEYVQEGINALRRGLYPHENNTVTQGSSPRVLVAVVSVLARALTHLVDGQQKFTDLAQPSSLSLADKKALFTAQIISFKQCMSALFASIDRNGKYYGDEPRIATKQVVTCDADGGILTGIEALECFSQATDDNGSLCDSCKNCPQGIWCSDCKDVDRAHSRVTPFIRTLAKETEQRVGVNDALWYMESRIGATSQLIDTYVADVATQKWQGSDRARVVADTRKIILQMAVMHKDIIEGIAKMSDEQLRVETVLPLLENAPGSIGLAESAVKNARSNNPLRFLPAQLFCKAALGSATQELDDATKDLPAGMTLADIARLVREGTKTSLGISEKELPLLCQLTHILSQPLNLLIKDGVICLRESAADVDRFALLYKKPLREQLLSPECSKQFDILAHAWKTEGIDTSGLKLIKNLQLKPVDHEQKRVKKQGQMLAISESISIRNLY